jgi:aspartate/methionine/tyrosine aminotransferase
VSAITDDSFDFCQRLLHSQGVAVTPGIDFGAHQANHYIRMAYSADLDRLQQAVQRLAAFIEGAS